LKDFEMKEGNERLASVFLASKPHSRSLVTRTLSPDNQRPTCVQEQNMNFFLKEQNMNASVFLSLAKELKGTRLLLRQL